MRIGYLQIPIFRKFREWRPVFGRSKQNWKNWVTRSLSLRQRIKMSTAYEDWQIIRIPSVPSAFKDRRVAYRGFSKALP